MKRLIKTLIFLVALYVPVIFSSALYAQEESAINLQSDSSPQRDGFWIGFGFGGGWSSSEDSFRSFGGRGAGFYFRAGGTVNEHVLLGGEILYWFRSGQGNYRQRGNVTMTALLYPKSDSEFFLKGGFGVATINRNAFHREGVGANLGAGIDLRIGKNVSVTPNVDGFIQFFENFTDTALLFTLGITWH